MHRVGFESTIPLFEVAKTLHVLDRAATVIGNVPLTQHKFNILTCILSRNATIEEALFSVDPTYAPIDWLDSYHVICA
jgi:hypothetical protein